MEETSLNFIRFQIIVICNNDTITVESMLPLMLDVSTVDNLFTSCSGSIDINSILNHHGFYSSICFLDTLFTVRYVLKNFLNSEFLKSSLNDG